MELEKNIERESSDQTALIRRGGRRGGVAVSFGGSSGGGVEVVGGGGGGGDVCIQLRADSSYANTANFLFYFISGAEICDLR